MYIRTQHRYVGSDRDTALNKFLREHDEKPGIVVLDEADKLDRQAWESLFTVLDRGNYDARVRAFADDGSQPLTRKVSCSKIIWILTTNILDNAIAEFETKQRELIQMAARQMEAGRPGSMAGDLQTSFDGYIRPVFLSSFPDTIGAAVTRRVDCFIPFFTFTAPECYVLAEMEINQMTIAVRRPPARRIKDKSGTQLAPIGNIALNVIERAIEKLSKGYDPKGGASSIKTAVKMGVKAPIVGMHLRGEFNIPEDDTAPVSLWLCTAMRNKEEKIEVRLTPPPPQIEEEGTSTPLVPVKKPETIFQVKARKTAP